MDDKAKAITETILDIIGTPGDWQCVEDYIRTELEAIHEQAHLDQITAVRPARRHLPLLPSGHQGDVPAVSEVVWR